MDRRITPRVVVGSTLFWIGLALATLAYAPVVALAAVLAYETRYALVVQWTSLVVWWLGVTCGLRHETRGLDNVPASPCVVLAKHQSAWETLVLVRYFRPQVWVLKRELLRLPAFGQALATLRPIAIDRAAGQNALEQVLEQGRERLASGCWVVVFPEGTRVPPGTRRRYKPGGATLAARAGYPVLPIAHDSGDFWPRNSFLKYPGTIRLVIRAPIDTAGRTPAEVNALAEEWIESTVAALRAAREAGARADAARR